MATASQALTVNVNTARAVEVGKSQRARDCECQHCKSCEAWQELTWVCAAVQTKVSSCHDTTRLFILMVIHQKAVVDSNKHKHKLLMLQDICSVL